MCSKENKGILVDEAVQQQAGDRFLMNSLKPIQAKGYDKPVTIFEPLNTVPAYKKKKSAYPFIGRKDEKRAIMSVADYMLDNPSKSSIVFVIGESGSGKSALATSVVDEIKEVNATKKETKKTIIAARSTSNETEQRIPLRCVHEFFSKLPAVIHSPLSAI
jgi:Cdc6-like AAA superfamily ATPase